MTTDVCWRDASVAANPLLQATALVEDRIAALKERVREFYYEVVLFQKPCPKCQGVELIMDRDGISRCQSCGESFDPTLAFQTCSTCDSKLVRKTYHYWCQRCRALVRSRYCFDERVFDAAYFREKMQESRERKQAKREQMQAALLNSRSKPFLPEDEPTLATVPGLEGDLNALIGTTVASLLRDGDVRPPFDLAAYRQHLLELVDGCLVRFEGVSRLVDDPRLDRVFRFITAIFLAHEGKLDIEQNPDQGLVLIGK